VGQPRVWLTHDSAAHWTQVASIPADHLNNGCAIAIDQRDPATAVAVLTWLPPGAGGGPSITDTTNYVTFNGGATWRKLTDPQPFMLSTTAQSATWKGSIYAIRAVLTGNAVHYGVWASSDHMATWRLIDPSGAATTDADVFWLAPATGEILAEYGDPYKPGSLWDTLDGGSHWKQIVTPAITTPDPGGYPFLAWMPGPHQPWTICSTVVSVSAGTLTGNPLTCSRDGGKTWEPLPAIALGSSAASASPQIGDVFAIASDGALLALLPGPDTSPNTLYRLSPGASQWQSLGDVPAPWYTVSYFPTPGSGVFWTDPATRAATAIASYS
jgi:hypothetical protein